MERAQGLPRPEPLLPGPRGEAGVDPPDSLQGAAEPGGLQGAQNSVFASSPSWF